MALDANYGAQAGAFWLSVALQHASSWLLLGLASWGVANIRQDPSEASSRSGWLTRWSPAVFARQPNRPLRPEQWAANPVRWLAEPDERQERRAVWLALLIMVGCGLLSFFLPGDQVLMVSLPVVWAFHWYLKIWLAAVAVHALGSARRSGLLELMLVTPLTTRQMVEGNYHALRGLLIKPALTLAGLELFLLVWQAAMSGKWALAGIFPVISGLLSLMADLYAVAWVGLWFGLSSGQPTQAVMRTVGYVLLLPLLALVLAPFCFFFCGIGWPALVGIKDLIFISWARNKLDREFRLAALAVPETA
jgi:hypothetical protein